MGRKGFVFTGMTLLLVIPVMLLAASFSNMVATGDKATSTSMRADVLFYAATNIRESFERTADELIYRSDCGETDVDAVKTNFTTVWAPYIEGTFAVSKGLNIEFDEDKINVTLSNQRFNIFNVDNGGGIPVIISDPDGNMIYTFFIGPLDIRAYGAPRAAITLPDVYNISYDVGDPIEFDASDSYDPTGDALTYSWTSSINGFLSDQGSFTSSSLANGSHTITLTVDDGDCGEDSVDTVIQLNMTEIGYCAMLGYFTGTCKDGTPTWCVEEANHIVHASEGDDLFCEGDHVCCEHSISTWCISLGGYTGGECSTDTTDPVECSTGTHEAGADTIYCGKLTGKQQIVCCTP